VLALDGGQIIGILRDLFVSSKHSYDGVE
jgi:hypothetical protein